MKNKLDFIKHVIAEDSWSYRNKKGELMTSNIRIGAPMKASAGKNANWVSPVWIEHFTPRILSVGGVGPVDALMNAMTLVQAFFKMHKTDFIREFNSRDKPLRRDTNGVRKRTK